MDKIFGEGHKGESHAEGGQAQGMRPAVNKEEMGHMYNPGQGATETHHESSAGRTGTTYGTDTYNSELGEEGGRKQKKDGGIKEKVEETLGMNKDEDKSSLDEGDKSTGTTTAEKTTTHYSS